jgi:hypothetical protein
MPTEVATRGRGASSASVVSSPVSVNIVCQGSYVRCGFSIGEGGPAAGGGRRDVVNEFSKAARRRLLALFNRMDLRSVKSVFLTLTYGQEFPSPRDAKKHLRRFLERLRRRWPGCSAVWRLEFQERGAPHFHLVLFGLPYVPKGNIQALWAECIPVSMWDHSGSDAEYPFTRIEMIESKRRLLSYVSKYVAKSEKKEVAASDGDEVASGFNLLAYLHAGEFVHPLTGEKCGSVGRWWGVFNADDLPMAVARAVYFVAALQAAYDFRRSARHVWRGVARRRHQGFSLFVGDAEKWWELWRDYCLASPI